MWTKLIRVFFFFQAEDGIRDLYVTGVQTCALPISAENVKHEVSVIIGYPFKTSSDATAEIGTTKFAMYTQNDGAWIKNVAEEARMVDAMRKGADLTVKGTSGRGTESTDQYSLKGLAQALDKIEQDCK